MQWSWPEKADVAVLVDKLMVFAEHRGYKAQKVGKRGDVLEISKGGTVRQVSGLSSGVRLVFVVKDSGTVVDVSGHGKEFGIKGAVGAAAAAIFLPLAALPAYGAYAQNRLIDDVKKEINDYFDSL